MKAVIRDVGIYFVLLFLLTACGGIQPSPYAVAGAANLPEPRVVTVTGDAEVRAPPDEVVLTLGVETQDRDLGVAKSQNDEIVQQVLGLSKRYGIEPRHVRTDYISIDPEYDYSGNMAKRLEGYWVRKTVVVILKDFEQFEDLLSDALEVGVNHVHDVEFRTTELRQYRDQARALAIQAAREKAQALAGELEQKIGEPVMIREEQSRWWSWYGWGWSSRWSGGMAQNVVVETGSSSLEARSTIAPGQITVRAQVTVSFELR